VLAKIARWLGDRISSIKAIQLPDMRNVVHNPSILVRGDAWECHLKGIILRSGISKLSGRKTSAD
jgi:hypothetical protein